MRYTAESVENGCSGSQRSSEGTVGAGGVSTIIIKRGCLLGGGVLSLVSSSETRPGSSSAGGVDGRFRIRFLRGAGFSSSANRRSWACSAFFFSSASRCSRAWAAFLSSGI